MKSSIQFFTGYYLKKHLGFLAGKKLSPDDIFWKNYYRFANGRSIEVLEEKKEGLLVKSVTQGKDFQAFIRTRASSDMLVFRQVFEELEYLPLVELIQKNKDQNNIRLLVDAGANVGYTSLFFKLFFPATTVVAIEPDDANARQIAANFSINKLDKTSIVEAGVWSHDCWLQLKKDKSGGKEWGFYVVESEIPTDIKAISLLYLSQLEQFATIDILKIDIEGSEAELFRDETAAGNLLAKTRYIAIEIHDDMADRAHIYRLLKKNNFSWFENSELTIGTNQSLLSSNL